LPSHNANFGKKGQRLEAFDMSIQRRNLALASQLYLTGVPAISAYLNQQRREIESEMPGAPSHPTQDACEACGMLSIPGWTCWDTITAVKMPLRHQREKDPVAASTDASHSGLKTVCMLCRSFGQNSLPTEPFKRKKTKPLDKKRAKLGPAERVSQEPSKVKTQRRKRGLQALLDKAKRDGPGPASRTLDLMDLMRRP
jgi:hypothetical protein